MRPMEAVAPRWRGDERRKFRRASRASVDGPLRDVGLSFESIGVSRAIEFGDADEGGCCAAIGNSRQRVVPPPLVSGEAG